jgi:hypothetical protein
MKMLQDPKFQESLTRQGKYFPITVTPTSPTKSCHRTAGTFKEQAAIGMKIEEEGYHDDEEIE